MTDPLRHGSRPPRCVWCREPLRFVSGRGYVHQDGALYRTRLDADGVERDDHCALPNWSERREEEG